MEMQAETSSGSFWAGTGIRLRAVCEKDLDHLRQPRMADDPFGWFGLEPTNQFARRFAETGLVSESFGLLMIETPQNMTVGHVGWALTQYGPAVTARAVNIGVYVRPEFRRRGVASAAQSALVDLVFATTLYNRVEAFTDAENKGEVRALQRAGLVREGVLRGAQWRAGTWHDLVLFGVVRADRGDGAGRA